MQQAGVKQAAAVAVFAVWAALVGAGLLHHEYWRDEVRALSLALRADSLLAVPASVRGEGHPVLWYLLLRGLHAILPAHWVLAAASASVAAAAVGLLLWRGPFALWWKALFVLGGVALYEYAVMARNYGLSMLLMFVFAAGYARRRERPLALGAVIFLMTQTSVHAALLAPLYAMVWASDALAEPPGTRARRQALVGAGIGAALAVLGLLAAFLTVYPSAHTLMTQQFVGRTPLPQALATALLEPGRIYQDLGYLPARLSLPAAPLTVLLYLALAGLWPRRALLLAGLLGLWGLALFFLLVYPAAGYRHQAVWLVFLVSLYWIARRRPAPPRPGATPAAGGVGRLVQALSWRVALPLLLLMSCAFGARELRQDLAGEVSKTRATGRLLADSEALRDAILLPEPEHVGEGVLYYADRPMYLVREGKFGRFATWTRESRRELTLGALLETARRLRDTSGRPVVLLIGHPLDAAHADQSLSAGPSAWRFSYSRAELQAFEAATRRLPLGPEAVHEHFTAHLLD